MTASTQPSGAASVGPGEYSARKQLDALASGAIDTATFLRSTLQRFRFESEESWEVLALLDQYHRLGKIPTEVFREVKVTIGEYAWRPRDANGKPLSKFNLPESPAPSPKATPAARQASPEPAQAGATRREMSAPTSKPLVAPRRTVPVTAPAAAAPPVNETADQTPRTAKPVRPTESENSVPPAPDPEIITQQLRVGREQRDPPPANPRPSPAERESIAEPEASIPPFREAAAEAAPHEIRVGDMLRRRYRIDGVIGTGSVGTVYEASDSFRLEMPPSGQRIAIKVFHAHLARRIETLTELRRDFQTLQSLSHPNILRAFEFERDHQFAFVTTELLNGATLERVLGARTDRPLQRPHALSIIRDVGAAIAYAHSRGVVHGDISPRAVFLTARGELRVLDFAAAHKQPNSPFSADVETFGATAATPAFASCQVLENDRPRVQDDIYSLACVAALLLGGRHPFDGRSAVEARIARVRPRRPAGITERQWHALRNALRFDRDKRPTDVQEWLKHMGLEHAAARLPPVNDLVEAPSGTGRRFGPGSVLFACVLAAAACYFVAVENDWVPSPDLSQLRAALLPAESTSHPVARADLETQAPPAAVEPPVSRPARTIPATQSAQPKAPAPTTTPSVASGSATAPNRAAALPSPTPKTAPANSSASGGGAPATVATHAKVEMAGDSLEVEPGSMAKVLVRRRGSLRGTTSFQWWTESGTAKPSKDFVPVLPRIEQMADGQATAVLLVSVTDAVRTRDKSFYVEIDATDGGAEMSGRTLTMVTLPANN